MSVTVLTVEETTLSPSLEAAWLADLPAARRSQLQDWPDVRARHRSLLGSRLLREGLVRLRSPAGVLSGLRYSRHGKPALGLPLAFSLAHCEGRIVCAFSTGGPLGVDIERIGPLTAADFRIYLSARERRWAGGDARRFYTLWTRKEAVVKAAGTLGLQQLHEVEVIAERASFAGCWWHTAPVAVGRGYVAHVARAAALSPPRVERIAAETLYAGGSAPHVGDVNC